LKAQDEDEGKHSLYWSNSGRTDTTTFNINETWQGTEHNREYKYTAWNEETTGGER